MRSDKMRHHLTSLHASIWDIVEFGAQVPKVEEEGYDSDEVAQIRHFNSQATTILLASLCQEEYGKSPRGGGGVDRRNLKIKTLSPN
jgi:hypothetical protein